MIRRLLVNTGSNYAILLMRIGITFFLTPLYVRYLGVYNFGIWEIVVATLGYTGLLDLGLGFSISRFIAKHRAEDDHQALLVVFNTVTAFLSSIGLVLALITLCIAVWCPWILGETAGPHQSYALFLAIMSVQVFITFPGIVAVGCLEGYQVYYIKNLLTFLDAFVVLGITLVFISKTNALLLLAFTSTLSLVWKYVAYLILLRRDRHYPLYFRRRYLSGSTLRSLLGFGIKGFIQGVSYQIQSRSGVFIIGFFLGAASVPLFTIPSNLAAYLSNITETGSMAFMPLFSELEAQGRRREILPLYLFSSKVLVAVIVLMSIGLLLLGPDFISLWVGSHFRAAAGDLLPYLVLATTVAFINPFGPRFLMALGRHGIYARVAPVALAVNVLLSVALVGRFGMRGIVAAAIIAALLVSGTALRVCCRLLHISVAAYLRRTVMPLIVPGLGMVVALLVAKRFVLIRGFSAVFGLAILGTLVYAVMFLAAALSRSERDKLLRLLGLQPAQSRAG
jgi:O-antigen/teichoic acid export membrane protein